MKFVNREKELALVRGLMEEFEGGSKPIKPVVGFYGPPGIGKTTLARELEKAGLIARWRVTFIAEHRQFRWPAEAGSLPNHLVIIDDLDIDGSLGRRPERDPSVDAAVVESLRRGAVVVSLSRVEPLWTGFFQIRMRLQTRRLAPFTPEQTALQLGLLLSDAYKIHRWSCGLPGLSKELYLKGPTPQVVDSWARINLFPGHSPEDRRLLIRLSAMAEGFGVHDVANLGGLSVSAAVHWLDLPVREGLISWSSRSRAYQLVPPLGDVLRRLAELIACED